VSEQPTYIICVCWESRPGGVTSVQVTCAKCPARLAIEEKNARLDYLPIFGGEIEMVEPDFR